MRKFFVGAIFVFTLLLSLQGPALIEQYIDHLQGHVEELKYQVAKLQEITGKKAEEIKSLITEWEERIETKEPILFISRLYDRFEKLKSDFNAFQAARFWNLPLTFIFHLDQGILNETLSSYRYGLSFTLTSIPFLIIGLILAILMTIPLRGSSNKI